MEEKLIKRMVEWGLNGVTLGEIQQRLSWLGEHLTEEEIWDIQSKWINKYG